MTKDDLREQIQEMVGKDFHYAREGSYMLMAENGEYVSREEVLALIDTDRKKQAERDNRLGGIAKELRQAKRDYFKDEPSTLAAITPFDIVSVHLEDLLSE